MRQADTVIFDTTTPHGHYQVVDMLYGGRPARVLFSGQRTAAQSGIATDDNPDLLFDYNQRFYELVTGVLPRRVLVIGGGMYTLPMALLNALPSVRLDVVELDTGLREIASKYFGLVENPRLRITHDDGRAFLDKNKLPYDVILVDAFRDVSIPVSLTSLDAVRELRRNLTPNGIVAINVISAYYGRGSGTITGLSEAYEQVFAATTTFPASRDLSLWLPQNLLLVGQVSQAVSAYKYLRYPPLGQAAPPFNLARDRDT